MKKVIENFIPQGGKHCITNSLKQIFSYYGYPMSEEMIFGIASGLSFVYINQSYSPMVNGRTKVFEFEKKLAEDLWELSLNGDKELLSKMSVHIQRIYTIEKDLFLSLLEMINKD